MEHKLVVEPNLERWAHKGSGQTVFQFLFSSKSGPFWSERRMCFRLFSFWFVLMIVGRCGLLLLG